MIDVIVFWFLPKCSRLPTATNGLGYQAETKGLDGKIYKNKTVKLYPTWQTVAQEN